MERQITLGDVIAPAKVLRCDNDDYPVLSMTMHDGIVLQSDRFKKSLASIDQSNYKVVLRGQLVVGFPIDEGVIYVQNIAEAGIMSPAYGVWNIHSKEIMPEYLELCLHSPQSMDYYKNKLRGTTARRRSITTGDLLALPITLPSITEQKRRISLLKQATLLLNSQKHAMLKFDELVKSRFIELFDNTPYDSNKVYLDEISDFVTVGIANSATHAYAESGVVMLRNQNIKENYLDENDLIYITPDFAKKYGSKKLVENDILVIRTGYPGIACLVPKKYEGCQTFTTLIVRLKAPTLAHANYVCHYINSSFGKDYVEQSKVGVAQQNFGAKALARMPILIPPMEIQEQFAAFVAEVDKSKLAVKQSLEKLETLKKSLMQQYFG